MRPMHFKSFLTMEKLKDYIEYGKINESEDASEASPLSEVSSAKLRSPDGSDEEEGHGVKKCAGPSWHCYISHKTIQVAGASVIALAFLALAFMLGSITRLGIDENACLDTAWDEVRDAVSFKTVEFNPRFTGTPSPYMGQPNPDVDRIWYDLAELRNFGVPKETLNRMNRSKGAVQFPESGRYQVGMEVFHQLHCLNYLRMYTYMDYYEKIDYDMVAESLEERRSHKDHCTEVLRQRLMRNPDLNVYSYHWTSRHEDVWGNLFTSHRCVDWERFHEWSQHNLVQYAPPKRKPEWSDVWD
ncbi:hypothetical protein BJ170DRAFT_617373 [Xylariales sp. AK1849]|nr:hypothetical protein BJ170DRAFT_617373 [Xylariales sp. AK1849]